MGRTRGRRRGWASRIKGRTSISLTSLMDILTCLLFFVLKSFVAGGEATVPPPGITLPASTADRAQATSLVVAIEKNAIFLGGERVALVREAVASDQMLIAPLAERLKAARDQMDAIAVRRGKAPQQYRLVTIQGDTNIEFRVLERVMYTLDQGGFPDIALAVIKKA